MRLSAQGEVSTGQVHKKGLKKYMMWLYCLFWLPQMVRLSVIFFFSDKYENSCPQKENCDTLCVYCCRRSTSIQAAIYLTDLHALWLMIWWNYIYNLFFSSTLNLSYTLPATNFPKTSCDFSWRRRHCL